MRHLFSLLFLLLLTPSSWAEGSADALQWLNRVTPATKLLTYSGTFIYQSDSRTETSRITHIVDGGREVERLEVLDGSPREVIRDNDEVKCYLPDSRLLVVERRNSRRSFPAVLPEGLGGLTDFYVIHRGPPARVAGFDTQSIVIDPRDELRYGRQFWIESRSGLLMKAGLHDEQGRQVESFTFTELRIGGPINRDMLKPHANIQEGDWRVHDIRSTELPGNSGAWIFNNRLPGFRQVSAMWRPARPDASESTHVVFSDGLAAISVFIEPLTNGRPKPETGLFSMGAINVYKRLLGNVQLVVMGDVPPNALKTLGDGIAPGKSK